MQRLSDSSAWVRFCCALLGGGLSVEEITRDADMMLKQYQKRFPAPAAEEKSKKGTKA